VPPPRHHCRWILTVGASDLWARLGVRCTPDMHCSLSGVPVWARLTSARCARIYCTAGSRWHGDSRCSGVAPDSPVNYSGPAVGVSRSWRVPEAASPWRTGQSGEL
jgi:hypothetical protein